MSTAFLDPYEVATHASVAPPEPWHDPTAELQPTSAALLHALFMASDAKTLSGAAQAAEQFGWEDQQTLVSPVPKQQALAEAQQHLLNGLEVAFQPSARPNLAASSALPTSRNAFGALSGHLSSGTLTSLLASERSVDLLRQEILLALLAARVPAPEPPSTNSLYKVCFLFKPCAVRCYCACLSACYVLLSPSSC